MPTQALTLTSEESNALGVLSRLLASFAAPPPAQPQAAPATDLATILKELKQMSDTFANEMTQLRNDVASQSTIISSATQAFLGLAAQLVAAEASAKNAGATDAQVAGLSALRQQLEANTASLAAAIPANTPAADPMQGQAPTQTPTSQPAANGTATVPQSPTMSTAPTTTTAPETSQTAAPAATDPSPTGTSSVAAVPPSAPAPTTTPAS